MEKNKRNTRGITLIALVITIIVLLILVGVTITVLRGENGILTQTSNAKMETRGANVEEAKNLWLMEKKLNSAKSLDDVLEELREQGLLTDDEVIEIKRRGKIKIGSRTIIFEKKVELVAKVMYDNYYNKYGIAVGFKDYQVHSDIEITKKDLENYTEKEKEDIFIKIINTITDSNVNNLEDAFKCAYEKEITSKLCTTLNEFAIEVGANSVEEMLLMAKEIWEADYYKKEQIEGEIIDPDGNKALISTANIKVSQNGYGAFTSYAYIYEITQNGSYTFEFLGNDKETKGNITITIDENHPCIVETWSLDFKTMLAGIGNFVNPEQARAENAIYRERYDGPESFDLTQNLEKTSYDPQFNEEVKQLDLIINKKLDADVILTYNGKEYVTKSDFWIPM